MQALPCSPHRRAAPGRARQNPPVTGRRGRPGATRWEIFRVRPFLDPIPPIAPADAPPPLSSSTCLPPSSSFCPPPCC
eukprot:6814643-Pyramimonas_sp.AAC.1